MNTHFTLHTLHITCSKCHLPAPCIVFLFFFKRFCTPPLRLSLKVTVNVISASEMYGSLDLNLEIDFTSLKPSTFPPDELLDCIVSVYFGHCLAACWSAGPMSLGAFSWTLVDKMFLYTSEFILLLQSFVTSSIKMSESVPEAAVQAQAMTLPPPCFTD